MKEPNHIELGLSKITRHLVRGMSHVYFFLKKTDINEKYINLVFVCLEKHIASPIKEPSTSCYFHALTTEL